MVKSNIKALTFDVFGTLLDWRGTLSNVVGQYLPLTEVAVDKFIELERATAQVYTVKQLAREGTRKILHPDKKSPDAYI